MQVYDKVNKTELTADTEELIKLMAPGGRQVDLYLKEKKSDEDGYMTWDVEHWSSVDGRRFIRCYSLEGRVLSESTGHNIYDLKNEFKPKEAEKVELSEKLLSKSIGQPGARLPGAPIPFPAYPLPCYETSPNVQKSSSSQK